MARGLMHGVLVKKADSRVLCRYNNGYYGNGYNNGWGGDRGGYYNNG